MVFSPPISWKSTWPRSHFLVTLLLIYYVTRKRCLPLHDVALGTTAHEVPYVFVAPLPPSRGRVWRVATNLCFTFLYLLLLVQFPPVYLTVSICGCGEDGHHLSQGRHSMFLRPGHDPMSYLLPEKAASVRCLDAVLGQCHLPCWRLIVMRHGGNVHRDVYCLLFLR